MIDEEVAKVWDSEKIIHFNMLAKKGRLMALKETEEFLSHYGVKGMKWGVRKQRDSGGRKSNGKVKLGLSGKTTVVGASVLSYVAGVKATQKLLGKPTMTKLLVSSVVGLKAGHEGGKFVQRKLIEKKKIKLSEIKTN